MTDPRSDLIDDLLDKLQAFDRSRDKIYWIGARCERALALHDAVEADSILKSSSLSSNNSSALELIRAKILMRKKKYPLATSKLSSLFESIRKSKKGQRKSILPIVCRELIDSASATSLSDGIDWLIKCQNHMPKKIIKKCSEELLESASFKREHIDAAKLLIIKNLSI